MLYVEYVGRRKDVYSEFNRVKYPFVTLSNGKNVMEASCVAAYQYFLSTDPEMLPLVPTVGDLSELKALREAREAEKAKRELDSIKRVIRGKIHDLAKEGVALETEQKNLEAAAVRIQDRTSAIADESKVLSKQLKEMSPVKIPDKPKAKPRKRKVKK